jgi:hypothetical protein
MSSGSHYCRWVRILWQKKNPAFKSAEAYFYLAYRNNEIVGRISAIVNWGEVNDQQKKKVRFGWFDVIDDIEVTKALLEKSIRTR